MACAIRDLCSSEWNKMFLPQHHVHIVRLYIHGDAGDDPAIFLVSATELSSIKLLQPVNGHRLVDRATARKPGEPRMHYS